MSSQSAPIARPESPGGAERATDPVWKTRSRRYLGLLRELTLAETRLMDQSSVLGFLWSFLHPALTLGVLYAFFRTRVGQDIPHYAAYLLIGIVHFGNFSKSTTAGMRVLQRMSKLAGNMIFPKEVLVFASILSAAPEFLIAVPIVVAIALANGVAASSALLALPVIVLLQLVTVLWISLLLSVLYVFLRDLDHIYGVALRILFFVTPIFYDLRSLGLGPVMRRVALLNPLTHLIGFSHAVILEGRVPTAPMLGFLVVNTVLLALALTFFRRFEPALIGRL